jgi:hypothetical protein
MLWDELVASCAERAEHAPVSFEREIGEADARDVVRIQGAAASYDAAPGQLDHPQFSGYAVLPELRFVPAMARPSRLCGHA